MKRYIFKKKKKKTEEPSWYLVELKFWQNLWLRQLETLLRHPAEKQQQVLKPAWGQEAVKLIG